MSVWGERREVVDEDKFKIRMRIPLDLVNVILMFLHQSFPSLFYHPPSFSTHVSCLSQCYKLWPVLSASVNPLSHYLVWI